MVSSHPQCIIIILQKCSSIGHFDEPPHNMSKNMNNIKVIRIEHPNHSNGLWYDTTGKFNPIIRDICAGSVVAEIPMEFNPLFRKDGLTWSSSARDINNLKQWFTNANIQALMYEGYDLFEIEVSNWVDTGQEIMFARQSILNKDILTVGDLFQLQ